MNDLFEKKKRKGKNSEQNLKRNPKPTERKRTVGEENLGSGPRKGDVAKGYREPSRG